MCVVTVVFSVKPEHAVDFERSVIEQARNSLKFEADCHRFDVAVRNNDRSTYFLYELYADKTAFETHLKIPHFKLFDDDTASWVANKTVHSHALLGE